MYIFMAHINMIKWGENVKFKNSRDGLVQYVESNPRPGMPE